MQEQDQQDQKKSQNISADCMLVLPAFQEIEFLSKPAAFFSFVGQQDGNLELLGCYAETFSPSFIVVDDLVFRKESFNERSYSASKQKENARMDKIEKDMNRQIIRYLFSKWPEADKKQLNTCSRYMAEKIQDSWRCSLAHKYPDREFSVEIFGEYDYENDIEGHCVTFSQRSGGDGYLSFTSILKKILGHIPTQMHPSLPALHKLFQKEYYRRKKPSLEENLGSHDPLLYHHHYVKKPLLRAIERFHPSVIEDDDEVHEAVDTILEECKRPTYIF